MDKDEFYRDARRDLSGPLDGVRVIDLTTAWAGPMAGCLLADFGADVVRVTAPGDVGNLWPPLFPGTQRSPAEDTVCSWLGPRDCGIILEAGPNS